jgi:hypothetical protein
MACLVSCLAPHAGAGESADRVGLPPETCGVWSWCSWNPRHVTRERCPHVVGVPIILSWKSLEPEQDDYRFDKVLGERLRLAKENGFHAQLMLWAGPGMPTWMYGAGVPKVEVPARITPRRNVSKPVFPYYFDKRYEERFFKIIAELGRYVRGLPDDLQARIVFVQSAEGSTGDGQPYKGKPLDPKYAITRDQWSAFRIRTWEAYRKAFQAGAKRPIPLAVNADANRGPEEAWLLEHLDTIGCKQGMFSHGYHISGTVDRVARWRAFLDAARTSGKAVFSRGEQDAEWKICGWSKKNTKQALYWSALFATHCGLDVWNLPADACQGETYADAIRFFNRYAGRRDPATSPSAFCALRRGLDASDEQAFPADTFGKVHGRNQERYVKIARAFSKYGAYQGDPEKAVGGGMRNRQRDDYNDAGWGILPGNYGRFLEQIDPEGTSVGWWHVEPKEHIYSRFARGFEKASGKTAMHFKLADGFFPAGAKSHAAKVRIVYLDRGKGGWSLRYASAAGPKEAVTMTCTGSGGWKEKIVPLPDATFTHALPKGSDLILAHGGGADTIFHMIELSRE